jgi:hypothetical protein
MIELRVFDGKMNETKEQAVKDFEKTHGFNPLRESQEDLTGKTKSPEQIREQVKQISNEERVYEQALKILNEEINKLSGYRAGKGVNYLNNAALKAVHSIKDKES